VGIIAQIDVIIIVISHFKQIIIPCHIGRRIEEPVKAVAVVGDAPMWAPPNRPETSSLLILFQKRKVHKSYD
jgi:hypothetical protein